jgi:hypothetical protein
MYPSLAPCNWQWDPRPHQSHTRTQGRSPAAKTRRRRGLRSNRHHLHLPYTNASQMRWLNEPGSTGMGSPAAMAKRPRGSMVTRYYRPCWRGRRCACAVWDEGEHDALGKQEKEGEERARRRRRRAQQSPAMARRRGEPIRLLTSTKTTAGECTVWWGSRRSRSRRILGFGGATKALDGGERRRCACGGAANAKRKMREIESWARDSGSTRSDGVSWLQRAPLGAPPVGRRGCTGTTGRPRPERG